MGVDGQEKSLFWQDLRNLIGHNVWRGEWDMAA